MASSEFWFHRPTDFFLLILNCALVVWSYWRKAGMFSRCRANSARSYADVCWPGASSPLGVMATVSSACRCLASALMPPMPWLSEPVAWARAIAASLAEIVSSAVNRSETL